LDSYYLIDGKVKFYFDQSHQSLKAGDESLPLQRREAQTLQVILAGKEDFVTAEAIAVYLWGEGPVNDDYTNKKSQAITHVSRIRKRLEQLGLANSWLETKGGLGYKVACPVEFVSNEAQRQEIIEQELSAKTRNNRLKMAKYSGLSALLTASMFILIYFLLTQPPVNIQNVVQLNTLSGISFQPRLSPKGDAITFSYQTDDLPAKIYLKADADINYRALTDGHFDQSPVFSPSGRQLAYQRATSAGGCEIRLIQLDQQFNMLGDDEAIAQCHSGEKMLSIEWLSEQLLLFTDVEDKETDVMGIYQVDLTSKEKSLYLSINKADYSGGDYNGIGYYYIAYDRKKSILYVLDGEDWAQTNIYQLSGDKVLKKITTVNQSLRSIAVLDNRLLFTDLDNQFKTMRIDQPSDIDAVYFDPLNPVSYPTVDESRKKIAFVSGEYYKSRIHTYSLKNKLSAEIISSDFKLRLPHASAEEVLLTSRESGINQIYAHINNNRVQLTNFTINRKISNFAASKDKKWLAIHFNEGTTLYTRNQKGLTEVRHFPLQAYPSFSLNSQRMLLADVLDKDKRVYEYDLEKYQQSKTITKTKVLLDNTWFAVYHPLGIVYVPSDKKGIHLLTRNSDEAINTTVTPTSPEGLCLSDSHLYVVVEKGRKVVSVDLLSGAVERMPDFLYGPISIYEDKLFYIAESLGHMNIVVGDISTN
jgi:DNA-binding winged helix-turn-helix (wHTH) protein/dipeptidyl aminopeptidase/acylaminoacyl peptidase